MEELINGEPADQTVAELLNNLKLGDETTRRYAAEDLGYGQYEAGISSLVTSLFDESIAVAEASADALVRIGGEVVASEIAPSLASEDVRLRNLSAEILSLLGEPAVPTLGDSLKSDNRDVRKFAVDTLAQIKSKSSINALIIALDDTDINVAASAADGIGELGDTSHVEILEKYIDSDVWMKCSIIRGIGMLGGEKAYKMIASAMKDEDMMVKVSCVQALTHIADVRSLPDLIGLLSRESLDLFGNEVLNTIEKIISSNPDVNISKYITDEEFKPIVTLALSDNQVVQARAIKTVGYFYSEKYVEHLVGLFGSSDRGVRRESCAAVINIKPKDISLLVNVLDDENNSVESKASAIHAIGQSDHSDRYGIIKKFLMIDDQVLPRVTLDALILGLEPVPINEIISLLTSSSESIRISAAAAMGRLGKEEFVAPLIEQLEDSVPEVVKTVDKALISIGAANSNSIIKPYLNSFNASERKMAFEYFCTHNPEQEQNKFLQGIADADPEVRVISLKVVENLGIADLDSIEKGLKDPEKLVKIQAARTIKSLTGSRKLVDFIKKHLDSKTDERVKVELAKVLSKLADFEAVDVLKKLLHDNSVWVQIEAVEALRDIGDSSVVDELQELTDSENDDLVEAAQMALEELDF